MKTGVIDVGGGLRGIYAAGVLDRCLDGGVGFDLCIGISAGSANISSFVAGQRGRNFTFYTEYAMRREYMSVRNFIRKRSYIDLDYVYSTLTNSDGEYPFDYDSFVSSPTDVIVIATEAATGRPRYFTKGDYGRDSYDIMKASSAIPFVCRPYVIDGVPYYDGALGDTIPLQKAFDMGCDRVVLILTKPKDKPRLRGKDMKLADMIEKRWPASAEALRRRAENYNRGVTLAKKLEAQGKVLIVAPDDTCGVDTLTKDRSALIELYDKGYADAAAIEEFISR